MSDDDDQLEYAEIMPRVAELVEEIMEHPEAEDVTRAQLEEMLDWIDVFHREGLTRMVELIRSWRGDIFLQDNLARDEIVGPFLEAYDLRESEVTT